MSLRQLFYASRVADAPGDIDIDKILRISRRNNRRLDVTGCLLYSGRHFAQVLEGRTDAVGELMARIGADPRHRGLKVIADRRIRQRDFPEWSMGLLYKLDVADRIEALLAADHPGDGAVLALMAEMNTDTVMGAL